MVDLQRLGKNIRSLRKAYGETQTELGEILSVEKNTISNYERGKREPDKKTLALIAQHYAVTIEDLLYRENVKDKKISIDVNLNAKKIPTLIPLISTEKALANVHFKRAYKIQQDYYRWCCNDSKITADIEDSLTCASEYLSAAAEDGIRAEAFANYIALCFFFEMLYLGLNSINDELALFEQLKKGDKAFRKATDSNNKRQLFEAGKLLKEHSRIYELSMGMMLTHLKLSGKWANLADYYLALRYMFNMVDNGLGYAFNLRIGMEMMQSFASVGNKYAQCLIHSSKAGLIKQ